MHCVCRDDLVPVMVKHIRSLRSQLCKVAILCFGDLVAVMRDAALPHVEREPGAGVAAPADSALCQLLLKSVSKEKMFVVEAAREVLRTCARCLEPRAMLARLVPYTKHKCAKPAHCPRQPRMRWCASATRLVRLESCCADCMI